MKQVIKGNHAVSHGIRLCRVEVISAYPITPQTTIVEELSKLCASGELKSQFIKVEGEHSAMAALIGSSSAGVRSFTATSSHGLLLMHEVLQWAAGARLPIVMTNVNRAVAGPGWNIWADQTDSLTQRDTGWLQFYVESNQEILDNIILAFKLAEKVKLPVMLSYDAFFLSHTSEVVDMPDISDVDIFLPPYEPEYKMDVNDPHIFGGLISPEFYYEKQYVMNKDAKESLDYYIEICKEFKNIFGREYDLVEEYRTDDADLIVVTAGTITSVTRIAIDKLRGQGKKVGLMKIRILRPVPEERWRKVLGCVDKIVVIDRNCISGLGGVFAAEIKAVLYPLTKKPEIFPVIAGLGGRDVTPEDVEEIILNALSRDKPENVPIFWSLKQ